MPLKKMFIDYNTKQIDQSATNLREIPAYAGMTKLKPQDDAFPCHSSSLPCHSGAGRNLKPKSPSFQTTTVIPAFITVIPAFITVIPAFITVIPAFINVIPAKAGISNLPLIRQKQKRQRHQQCRRHHFD